jgi:hypothetical protein
LVSRLLFCSPLAMSLSLRLQLLNGYSKPSLFESGRNPSTVNASSAVAGPGRGKWMVAANETLQVRLIDAGQPWRRPGAEETAGRSPAAQCTRPIEPGMEAPYVVGGSSRVPQSPIEAVARPIMSSSTLTSCE